jgi:hypothetical protein
MKFSCAIRASPAGNGSWSRADAPSPGGMPATPIEVCHLKIVRREGSWTSQTHTCDDPIDVAASPGFEYRVFEIGLRDLRQRRYAHFCVAIGSLTRAGFATRMNR